MTKRAAIKARLSSAVLLVVGAATPLVAQNTYQRPTAQIILGRLPESFASSLASLCATQCADTRWYDRVFSEGVQGNQTKLTLAGTRADSVIANSDELAAAARQLIATQFLVGANYVWRTDTLYRRAEYGLSFTAAQREARRVNGPDPRIYPVLTANYLFVVSGAKEPEISVDGKKTTAKAEVNVAVFRIAYDSVPDVIGSLSPFYCEERCADRERRKQAFTAFRPPVRHAVSYSVSVSGESEAGAATALQAMASSLLDEIIDETAGRVRAFAVQERLIGNRPAAARIGRKEGVLTGTRFFVYRTDSTERGVSERRGAMLLARRVADNRVETFSRTATTVTATRVDSTTFARVHPGAMDAGDVIREKPTAISIFLGATFMGFVPGNPERGFAGEIRDESFTPGKTGVLGLRAIGALKVVPTVATVRGTVPRYTFVGAGLGYEFFPLAGMVRLTPTILGFASFYDDGSDGSESELERGVQYSAEIGIDVGVRVTPGVELVMAFRQTGRAELDPVDPTLSKIRTAPNLQMGLRLQRGRFGF
jgi:hypothetical protein